MAGSEHANKPAARRAALARAHRAAALAQRRAHLMRSPENFSTVMSGRAARAAAAAAFSEAF